MAGAFPTPGTWATLEDLPPTATDELKAQVGDDTLELALSMASTVLYNLTDQRWPGPRSVTIWPCPCTCRATSADHCGCGPVSALDLGSVAVTSVTQVRIDGEVIPPEAYELQNDGHRLVWIGTDDLERTSWPTTQRLGVPAGDPGTWSVTFVQGRPVPSEAVAMAGRLGWELALLMTPTVGAGTCRFSEKTVQAMRRGATQQKIDPAALIQLGATGLPEVDLWVQAIRRGRARRGARIRRPGGGSRPGPTRAG